MDKLKVCLLNDSFPPMIDGVANAVVNYANVISNGLGEVVVATPQYPNVVDNYPFRVIRYPSIDTTKLFGYRAGYPLAPKTADALTAFKPSVIHSHCPVSSMILGRLLREATGAPLIMTYHTKFDIDIKNAIKSKLLAESSIRMLVDNISAADEVWAVSRGAGENLVSLGFKGEYVVMENGVDFARGIASRERVDALRKQHGFTDDDTAFLFVGRLMWYKGIRLILAGLNAAAKAGARFKMVFVGDGQDREEMERFAMDLGINEFCVFTGAVHDRELLRDYFSLADLFLFPSTFDTNGIVVREAAACGLGSLLIEGSCAAEGVTCGHNAILIHEDVDELARVVLGVCKDREHYRQIGEHAMDELYVSWEDSVKHAAERYRLITTETFERRRSFTDEVGSRLVKPYSDWSRIKLLTEREDLPTRRRSDRYL